MKQIFTVFLLFISFVAQGQVTYWTLPSEMRGASEFTGNITVPATGLLFKSNGTLLKSGNFSLTLTTTNTTNATFPTGNISVAQLGAQTFTGLQTFGAGATISTSQFLTITDATASRALVSDASSRVVASTVTTTRLQYLASAGGTTGTTSTNLVFSTSPTLVTPTLGVAAATSINKVAITAPATSATLTIANGKTLTASNTLTFTGTDASSVAFGAGGTVAYLAAQSFTGLQTFNAGATVSSGQTLSTNTLDATSAGALTIGSTNATAITLNKPVTLAATAQHTLLSNLGTAGGGTFEYTSGIADNIGIGGLYSSLYVRNRTGTGAYMLFHAGMKIDSAGAQVPSNNTTSGNALLMTPTSATTGVALSFQTISGNSHTAGTSGLITEKFSITQAGALTIGPASGLVTAHVIQNSATGGGVNFTLQVVNTVASGSASSGLLVQAGANNSTTDRVLELRNNDGATTPFAVFGNGQVFVRTANWGTGGTAVGFASDRLTSSPSSRRYKTNERPISTAELDTSKIWDVETKVFEYNEAKGGATDFSPIAEDVAEILPQIVWFEKDETGNSVPESIRESRAVWILLEEMKKERAARIALEARLATSDDVISALLERVEALEANTATRAKE